MRRLPNPWPRHVILPLVIRSTHILPSRRPRPPQHRPAGAAYDFQSFSSGRRV
jgi:hypothetical protein